MIIRTNRLKLRPFESGDFMWFKNIAINEEVKTLLPGVACYDDETVRESIAIYAKGDFVNDFYYVICDMNDNEMGIIVATRIDATTIDVSYFLKKECRHQGYMTEAIEGLANYARSVNRLYRFRFVISEYNQASLNVVKKLGAVTEKMLGRCICFL